MAALVTVPIYAQRDPDTDGDGIPNSVDQCPREPGPRDNRGCPVSVPPPSDRDGDTVIDEVDNYSDQPGPRENFGCLVANHSVPTSAPQPTRPAYRPAARHSELLRHSR